MITTVIIDDKEGNVQTLQQLLMNYCPQVKILGSAYNMDQGYDLIVQMSPALVFLDIEMPGGNGFDLLRKFKQINFHIIFVTAFNQYAVQAFRASALDYLLKPIDIDELQEAVLKAEQQLNLKDTSKKLGQYLQGVPVNKKIPIPVLDGFLFVNSEDIVRCEGAGSYSFFYMKDGKKLTVSMRLKECEDLLSDANFFRVHNSHLVNLGYVSQYVRGRGGHILMKNGNTVEVASSRKESFLGIMRGNRLI